MGGVWDRSGSVQTTESNGPMGQAAQDHVRWMNSGAGPEFGPGLCGDVESTSLLTSPVARPVSPIVRLAHSDLGVGSCCR